MTTSQKVTAIVGIIAVAALMYWARSCGIKSVTKHTGIDTVYKTDSFTTIGKPVPYKVDSFIYIRGKDGRIDTLWGEGQTKFIPASVDTAEILREYYQTAYYREVIDSGSVKVTIEDTVTQNRISGRSVEIKKIDTTIRQVTVLRPPQKFVLSWGLQAMGNPNPKNLFHMGGVDLSLKTPNNIQYGIGTFVDKDGRVFFGLQYRRPIVLRKR